MRVYEKLLRADDDGRGVLLTARDVRELFLDDDISAAVAFRLLADHGIEVPDRGRGADPTDAQELARAFVQS